MEERIKEFDMNKGSVLVEKHEKRSPENTIRLYNEGVPIVNFVGGFEMDVSILEEEVPEHFINSSKSNENGTKTQKKWKEYCIHYISLDNAKALLRIGYVNDTITWSRQDPVQGDEFSDWYEFFKDKSELLTWSLFANLLLPKTNKYNEKRDEE